MKEYFERIRNREASVSLYSLTVTEGKQAGEKALLADGELLWQSAPDGFAAQHQEELAGLNRTGLFELAGVRVFVERISRGRKMVVCGGGHVAIEIIRLAERLGFHVIVLEDRPLFAGNAREAGADVVLCDAFENSLQTIPGDEDTYFVIVTRGHRFDEVCLSSILKKKHAYIGMMGSHRRTEIVRRDMVALGFTREEADAVHAPIGLAIGAETPEEIAISVMAEIIAVKSKKGRDTGISDDILEAVLGKQVDSVLATIISRKGSAPREVGTKMLIEEDGTCVDTIGGGCVEAEVIRRARMMLADEKEQCVTLAVDLTADAAEQEGMVCGGKLEVLLERV
ncbi:MAG: XdhC family protein [Lachnospiraceae bacterium]|nr:XdhC family protein [Lachnospiraceae bacterium]